MRRPIYRAALLACVLAGLGASSVGAGAPKAAGSGSPTTGQSAKAAPSGAPSAADEAFRKAQEQFLAKDYAAALPAFEQLLAQSGSPNARLYVARCHKELGHLGEAYEQMERTLRDATRLAPTEPKYEGTRNNAAVALAMMDQLVGKIVVAMAETPSGIELEVAGRKIDAERIGQPIAVEAGRIVVNASAPGRQPAKAEIEVPIGKTKTVTLTLAREAGRQSKPQVSAEPGGGQVRTAGIVVAGVGAASLVAFAITGGLALSNYNRLRDECGGVRCTDLAYAGDVDTGKTLRLVANVTLAAGAACLAAGTMMIIFGGPSEEPSAASLEIAPSGPGFVLRGRF